MRELSMIIQNLFTHEPQSEAFKQFQSLLPAQTDSAVQALQKYESLFDTVLFEYDIGDDGPVRLKIQDVKSELLKRKPETSENIKRYEEKHGMKVPQPLLDFLQTYGLFEIQNARLISDDGTVMSVNRIPVLATYNHNDTIHYPNILDLPYAIANNFSENFMTSEYSAEEIETFKKNFFVFGYHNINDQEYDYLFFTKDGRFGSFNFQDEDYVDNKKVLDRLLDHTAELMTFDQLISRYVGKSMMSFAETLADY